MVTYILQRIKVQKMIELPNFERAIEFENNFYLSCANTRLSKALAHYELFKMTQELPGAIVECGIFKGASFVRFASYRELLESTFSRKLIGFDIFGKFPETKFDDDFSYRENFIKQAGEESITKKQLFEVLKNKGITNNIDLIEGDINETVPQYLIDNPHLKISLLNLDTDIYEPAVTILENFWPRIVRGGILVIDDYGVFPGETKAVDDFFRDKKISIKKFSFAMTPSYIIKDE